MWLVPVVTYATSVKCCMKTFIQPKLSKYVTFTVTFFTVLQQKNQQRFDKNQSETLPFNR